MTTFSDLIRAVFRRWGNHPEYLDVSRLNERMRVDLGLTSMTDADRRDAVRDKADVRGERPACNPLSINTVPRQLF
jgi:hypothetical protein